MGDAPGLPTSYQCPVCRRVTYNENDIAAAYCPCCGSPATLRQCEHPRLYENKIPNPAGPEGRSDWYLYRTLCLHGYMAQQVVRPPGGTIPMEVQVEAILANHHRVHECRCFVPVFERYKERMAARPDLRDRDS